MRYPASEKAAVGADWQRTGAIEGSRIALSAAVGDEPDLPYDPPPARTSFLTVLKRGCCGIGVSACTCDHRFDSRPHIYENCIF
jgi:hypothetical protein